MYTVVIDESGDVGLENVLPDPSKGPTQYFCMCATIFNEANRQKILQELEPLKNKKGQIHASSMDHFSKVNACRIISKLPVGMVGVISNKLTLLEYLPEAKKTPTHYYNKVAQYLFERIGDVVGAFKFSSEEIQIRLEAREQQYSSLLSLIDSIQRNPLDSRSLSIRKIDRFSISAIKKQDDMSLAISDIGANALFSAVRRDHRSHGLTEPRYLKELSSVFLCGKDGKLVPKGLKPIHSIEKLGLDDFSGAELIMLSNPTADYRRL